MYTTKFGRKFLQNRSNCALACKDKWEDTIKTHFKDTCYGSFRFNSVGNEQNLMTVFCRNGEDSKNSIRSGNLLMR
jgi:hypothetical protein